MPKPLKIVLRIFLIVLALLVVVVGGYIIYAFAAYHRIGDASLDTVGASENKVETLKEYTFLSYNIGFGAYEDDYGFFMDGGTQSRAWSLERLEANMGKISDLIKEKNADFSLIQEVDTDSTRTYHLNECDFLTSRINKTYTFCQNYDSVYLMYPILEPHGASKSGLLTFADFGLKDAERVELPVESGFSKFFDLDRCYSKQRVDVEGYDGQLVVYNFHLSAYTSDGTIADKQLEMIVSDMQAEYEKGNYCIAGGDFNKDILGDSSRYFGVTSDATWARALPDGLFDETNLTLVAPIDEENPVPSCRNADGPYNEDQFVITIDGFIVSDNINVVSSAVVDTQFEYSDHNPVEMTVVLDNLLNG